jgi:hypothetical protein
VDHAGPVVEVVAYDPAWPGLFEAERRILTEAMPCPGSGKEPAEDVTVASWLPVLRNLTPHGLRHGLQTWMVKTASPTF